MSETHAPPIHQPHPRRGSLGTAHIHPLSGLVRAAQAKHGSVEGIAAAVRERAAKRERAAASKQEAAEARRQALAAAAGLEEIRCRCWCWEYCSSKMPPCAR